MSLNEKENFPNKFDGALSFLVGHELYVNFIFILVRNVKLSNLSNMNFFVAINVSTYTKDS
jgi:hypothetical protein